MQVYTEKAGNHLYGWITVFPSQPSCGEGRVGRGFFFFRWKRDNILFSLFYGIGIEREEGGVIKGCINYLLYVWKIWVCVYVDASGGILWSYRSVDG